MNPASGAGAIFAAALLLAAAPVSAASVKLEVAGEPQPVFTWKTDRCDDEDVPDAQLRAFRRDDGTVVAFASQAVTWPLVGPDLLDLKRKCEAAFRSAKNPDPAAHAENTWLTGLWTENGRDVAALGHNEYHAETHPGRCAGTKPLPCRYDVVTLLASHDGGRSFAPVSRTPVAAPPIRQPERQDRTIGMLMPSNVVERDGYKYAFIRSAGGGAQEPATCLLRAKDPMRLDAWEIFRDGAFAPSAFDPYRTAAPAGRQCSQIPGLNGLVFSVLRHEPTGLFVALLVVIDPPTRKMRLAVSSSKDLTSWTAPQVATDIVFQWSDAGCPQAPYWHYPSLIDPGSTRRNFDTIDGDALLFMSRLNVTACKGSLDRDLVRIPVRLTVEP